MGGRLFEAVTLDVVAAVVLKDFRNCLRKHFPLLISGLWSCRICNITQMLHTLAKFYISVIRQRSFAEGFRRIRKRKKRNKLTKKMHLSSCHATGKLTPVDISADNFDSYFPKRLLKFSYTSSVNVLKLVVRRVQMYFLYVLALRLIISMCDDTGKTCE